MPSPSETTLSYHLRGWSIAYLLFMCSLFSGLFIFLALTQKDNIVGIEVGQPFGALFYGTIAASVAGMAIFMLYRTRVQKERHSAIVFATNGVTLPASLISLKPLTLRYKDIEAINKEKIERTGLKFIHLRHGKQHTRISDMGFANAEDFDRVFQLLNEKAGR